MFTWKLELGAEVPFEPTPYRHTGTLVKAQGGETSLCLGSEVRNGNPSSHVDSPYPTMASSWCCHLALPLLTCLHHVSCSN